MQISDISIIRVTGTVRTPFHCSHAGRQEVTVIGADPAATEPAELVVETWQMVWVDPTVVEFALCYSVAHLLLA